MITELITEQSVTTPRRMNWQAPSAFSRRQKWRPFDFEGTL
jgi:hypothetical protein